MFFLIIWGHKYYSSYCPTAITRLVFIIVFFILISKDFIICHPEASDNKRLDVLQQGIIEWVILLLTVRKSSNINSFCSYATFCKTGYKQNIFISQYICYMFHCFNVSNAIASCRQNWEHTFSGWGNWGGTNVI